MGGSVGCQSKTKAKLRFDVDKTKVRFTITQVTFEPSKSPSPATPAAPLWLRALSDDDLAFVRRLVLASGSLKDVAAEYGVSYPTLRLRLDRLIDKVKLVEANADDTPFQRALRLAHAEGRVDLSTARQLMAMYRQENPVKPVQNGDSL
jgi:hypothetical protein